MSKIVQFIHPGRQAARSLVTGDRKLWNQGPVHYRAFIEARGVVLSELRGRPEEKESIRFWGEWEAQGDVVGDLPPEVDRADPKMCIRPRPVTPAQYDRHQNTDPFVFDGEFRYCVCRQASKPSLKALARGDLILFGSNLDGGFVLDTMFVVADRAPYEPGTRVPVGVPKSFRAVTDWALARGKGKVPRGGEAPGCVNGSSLVLYRGATPEERIGGMFSFAPAVVKSPSRPSFRRPELSASGALAHRITPSLKQGVKITAADAPEVEEVWREVVHRVLAEGLLLGTAFHT